MPKSKTIHSKSVTCVEDKSVQLSTDIRQIVLPPLEPWQIDVYNAVVSDPRGNTFVVKARRQVGKSILAEMLLITFSLDKRKRTSIVVEPTLNQSRRVFKQIVDMLEGSGLIKNANGSLLSIEFINRSEILFKSAEQKEALRGMTVSGILVVDEAAFIEDDVFELLFPTVDANLAPMLVISTPLFTDGMFYSLFNSPNSIVFDWSKYDTSKYLSNEKLEKYRKELSPTKFKSEYLGEFITEGSFVFTNIKNCIKRTNDVPIYGGIDWAVGNNGDFTVLTLMDKDGIVVDIISFNNIEPTEQIRRLADKINSLPSLKKVQIELNSIGSVYADYLRKAVHKPYVIQGFNTNNDSKRRIVEQLASAFQKGTIGIPDDEELIRELNHYAVERTSTGKVAYNGLNAHDDYVISLALAYDLISSPQGTYSISLA